MINAKRGVNVGNDRKLICNLQKCHIRGDVVITDPCYLVHGYDYSGCSNWMTALSIMDLDPFIQSSTIYGDWSCTTYDCTNVKNGGISKPIGEFCADSGLVCICELSNILSKNPSFEQWIKEHDWCVTVIRNFVGEVQINEYKEEFENEHIIVVEGFGIKDGVEFEFTTKQTGL